MKGVAKGIVASSLVSVVLSVSGCKHQPNPPTEQDAIAVAKNVNKCRPIGNDAELISLKKTNGQIETINGTKVYTLYYTATKRNLIQVGIHPPGWTESGRATTLSNGLRRAGKGLMAKSIRSINGSV